MHNCKYFFPIFQKPLQPDMGHNSLANFQIEKKIGRGQFSEVYRARYLLDNTSVALKKVQVRNNRQKVMNPNTGRVDPQQSMKEIL